MQCWHDGKLRNNLQCVLRIDGAGYDTPVSYRLDTANGPYCSTACKSAFGKQEPPLHYIMRPLLRGQHQHCSGSAKVKGGRSVLTLLAYLGALAFGQASRVLCSSLQKAIPDKGHRQALGML